MKDPIEFVGNRTECALLMLLRTWGTDYKTIRDSYSPMVEKVWDFDSAKKMAGVLIKTADGHRLYNKACPVRPLNLPSDHSLCLLHQQVHKNKYKLRHGNLQLMRTSLTRIWDMCYHA